MNAHTYPMYDFPPRNNFGIIINPDDQDYPINDMNKIIINNNDNDDNKYYNIQNNII